MSKDKLKIGGSSGIAHFEEKGGSIPLDKAISGIMSSLEHVIFRSKIYADVNQHTKLAGHANDGNSSVGSLGISNEGDGDMAMDASFT